MFKNILKFLFEEEEEDLIEEPMEEIRLTDPKPERKEETKVVKAKVESKPKQAETIKVVEKLIQKNETVVTATLEPKQKNRFIDFDEPQKERPMIRATSNKSESKRDFDFAPVISPIFGTKEDIEERNSTNNDMAVVRVKKKNPLGTIISPMYGATELEAMEYEAQSLLARQDTPYSEDESDFTNPTNETEMLNMPLEDLLSKDEEDNDDLMQFSLFGGEEAIKERNADHVLSIDDEE